MFTFGSPRLNRVALPVAIVAAVSFAACGGAKDAASNEQAEGAEETQVAAKPVSFDPASITDADLALGDSIFHGLIGATSCQSCHGPKGENGAAAPSLADTAWLHSDGSFESIYKQIETGVMQPKQFSGVMPPFGGAPLDPQKHRAVAAYVYKLSHK